MPIVITSAFGSGSVKKIKRRRRDSIGESRGRDFSQRDPSSGRKICGSASKVRVFLGHEHRQLASCTADITEGLITREVELVGERLKIACGDSAHRIHELLEPLGPAVELGEHRRAGVFNLVLRLAGAEAVGEIAPESIKASVGHLKKATHKLRAVAIEEQRSFLRVAIAGFRSVAVTLEKAKRHQCVEEIGICSRMQLESKLQLAAGHGTNAELCEKLEL
jgi:hypothetical protein